MTNNENNDIINVKVILFRKKASDVSGGYQERVR